jgi:membrane associated rhomboid family serine protease
MSRCPNCRNPLEPQNLGIGVSYLCDNCGGAAIGINALKNRNALKSFVDGIWQKSRGRPKFGRKLCPFCQQLMVEVEEDIDNSTLNLDICNKCMMVWFDKGEQEKFPKQDDSEELSFKKVDNLSPESREALAEFDLKETRRQDRESDLDLKPPDSFLKKVLTVLGFPTTSDNTEYKKLPAVLFGISAIIIIVYIFDVLNSNILIDNWGLTPSQWQRYYCFNFVSSFFVHAGFEHILFNLYFFVLFGRKIEWDLGKLRFAILLFVSHLLGIFSHFILSIDSQSPVVGASAGISGIMAYYALTFPRDKIYFFRLIYFKPIWFRLSIQFYFILFVLLQLAGTLAQFTVGTSISYVAHLGGIFGGIVMALWIRESRREQEIDSDGERTLDSEGRRGEK